MTSTASTAAWLEEELRRVVARVETLTRETAQFQSALGAARLEADELRQSLTVIDGRTLRQEAAHDLVREAQQAVTAFEERLADEVVVRREQTAALARVHEHEQQVEQALERSLSDLRDRVAELERSAAAASERHVHLAAGVAAGEGREAALTARIESLSEQVDALSHSIRSETGGTGRHDEPAAGIEQMSRSVEVQVAQLRSAQRQFEADVAALRRLAERDELLQDMLEQQRVLRLRVEAGLATLDARMAAAEEAQLADAEERRLLRARLDSLHESIGTIVERLDGHRDVLLEHFRRATATAEDAGRRQVNEIDRQARAARELLVRLAENADSASREQPL